MGRRTVNPMPPADASDKQWGEYYRREAGREYHRAEREARDAARWYEALRAEWRQLRWLVRRGPELWENPEYGFRPPEAVERGIRALERLANHTLEHSFDATARARWCNSMARRYEQRWAKLVADVEAYKAERAPGSPVTYQGRDAVVTQVDSWDMLTIELADHSTVAVKMWDIQPRAAGQEAAR